MKKGKNNNMTPFIKESTELFAITAEAQDAESCFLSVGEMPTDKKPSVSKI